MERLICLVIGYICGLFQTSYFIGKWKKTDIREHGSGNAGTTNALRTFGKKAAAVTLIFDAIKAIVAVLTVQAIFKNSHADILPLLSIYAGLGAVLGHNFPFYMGFRGGKGFAASVGFAIAFDYPIFLVGCIVFAVIVAVTRYVSLGTLTVYLGAFIYIVVAGQCGHYEMTQMHLAELYCVMGFMTILTFYRHKANISRLLKGTENKISFTKKE